MLRKVVEMSSCVMVTPALIVAIEAAPIARAGQAVIFICGSIDLHYLNETCTVHVQSYAIMGYFIHICRN